MSVVVFPRDELCYIESQLLLSLLTRLWMLIKIVYSLWGTKLYSIPFYPMGAGYKEKQLKSCAV